MKTIFKFVLISLLLAAPTAVTVEAQARLCTNGNCKSGKNEKAKTVRITRTPSSNSGSGKHQSIKPANTKAQKGNKGGIRGGRYSTREKQVLNQTAPRVKPGVKGGSGSQIKQNHVAAKFNMESLIDETGRNAFINKYGLVRVTSNNILKVKLSRPQLKENYLFGFSAQFFYDLGRVAKDELGSGVTLTSMWRSEKVQKVHGQAATRGIVASSHPLATTADLGRNSNSKLLFVLLDRIAPRLESYRTSYSDSGRMLGVVEILRESTCYHIMVFPSYDLTTRAAIQQIMREEARKLKSQMRPKSSNRRSKRR